MGIITQKSSFETPSPPIPDELIKSTFSSEVVVVGAGIAGLMAALAAVESNSSVIIVEKSSTFNARGGDVTALNTRLHEKLGIKIDANKILHDLMKVNAARINQRIFHLWARNSARVMNLVMDMLEKEGLKNYLIIPTRDETVVIDRWPNPSQMPPNWNPFDEYTYEYPTCHHLGDIRGSIRLWLSVIEKKILERGTKICYDTRAVQLIRDKETGHVTSVIAEDKEKNYLKFNASKGIILATGDYSYNREMVDKYFPGQKLQLGLIPTSMGEGHQMAMWIGAVMEKTPHAPLNDISHALGTNAFLFVNRYGERFCNEDLDSEAMARQAEEQHGMWTVFDASWPEDLQNMGLGFYRVFRATERTYRNLQDRLEKGTVLSADSIEDLAQKMNVPVDRFKKTIERYNELVKNGCDLDFGKRSDRMTAVGTSPFYAGWTPNPDYPMLIFGGLICNERLQPLDSEGKTIQGLYLAGNTVGGRFKLAYPLLCPGISHGMAMTTGYLAGEFAVNKKICINNY
ncbi:FAD-dependent oxidoreductase [Candidatus Bathyarchaeota archaeon]|nr:FAD-dependent oxidoreductase [Candidatus Bathyarchaeota archaeon]